MRSLDQYIKQIEKEISGSSLTSKSKEIGTVLEVKDGVAILEGLDNAFY
ncbi:MAG: hypothetical protein AAB966_04025 [Patescibacteria group bacterium]